MLKKNGLCPLEIGNLLLTSSPFSSIYTLDLIDSDYGLRWGIEALFSDLKTRGFSVTKTQLKHADRIERLLLVLTIALYWAVSTGMQPRPHTKISKKKFSDL